jgi:hypothetical protein
MLFGSAYRRTIYPEHHPLIDQQPKTTLFAAGLCLTILLCALFPGDSLGGDTTIFQQFTQHIGRQIHKDKLAFAQANTCVSRFYKAGKMPPPTVQRISWSPTTSDQLDMECLRHYPRGMDDARDNLGRTQSVLSISLTFYQFALVADRDDDAIYGPVELQDLLRALSLTDHDGDPTPKQAAALTGRFDSWYHGRNMDALMQGMTELLERGYRVTPSDRVELDRVMG